MRTTGWRATVRSMLRLRRTLERYWHETLSTRGWAGSCTWAVFNQLKERFSLQRPKDYLSYRRLETHAGNRRPGAGGETPRPTDHLMRIRMPVHGRDVDILGRSGRLRSCAVRPIVIAVAFGQCPVWAESTNSVAPIADAEQVYMTHCASCHGTARRGGEFGPALTGDAFRQKWLAQGRHALDSFVREAMPPMNPGGLAEADYEKLVGLLTDGGAGPAAGGKSATGSGELESGGAIPAQPNYDRTYTAEIKARREILARLSPVTDQLLQDPPAGDWLAYRRTYENDGFSPLTSINTTNVEDLQLAWSLALPDGTNEIAPLAHDGVLFVNGSGTVFAIDGAGGDVLWSFRRHAQVTPMGPPVSQPKGMALYGDSVIVPTSDNHVLALRARSGEVMWDKKLADSGGPLDKGGALRITAPPIVVHGKILLGMSGCAGSGRCFLAGLSADNGNEEWRVDTIPRPDAKDGNTWGGIPDAERNGGSIWDGASYDPINNLAYVGVAQTYHIKALMEASAKKLNADALYTDSTLAIDPDTGKLKWYYQHMRRDVWDMDWAFERAILSSAAPGVPRRMVATVGKLGILDLIDAKTGKYIYSYDLGFQNLVTRIDAKSGDKITDPALEPEYGKPKVICPFSVGVRNWPATAFDPAMHTLFVPYTRSCMQFVWSKGGGFDIGYGFVPPPGDDRNLGGIAAIDVATRQLKWRTERRAPPESAALSTAGGLVFAGFRDRFFSAYSSATGSQLWSVKLDQVASSTPITFSYDGVQYLAVTTGAGNPNEFTTRALTPEIEAAGPGVRLWVFKLADRHRVGSQPAP
jgi:alcohol dehydrogenase (cytochrome c)